jgi:hypothetical protein
LREEDLSDRAFSLLLFVDAVLLLLLTGELCERTVALRLLELLLCGLAVASRLLFVRTSGAFRFTFSLRLLFERSTAPALPVVCVFRFRVAGFTVADRSGLLLVLVLRMFLLSAFLVLLFALFSLLLALSTLLLRSLVDLLSAEDRTFVALSLDTSGRYSLTVLLLTLVDLPERLFELSSLCTVAFLPAVRS